MRRLFNSLIKRVLLEFICLFRFFWSNIIVSLDAYLRCLILVGDVLISNYIFLTMPRTPDYAVHSLDLVDYSEDETYTDSDDRDEYYEGPKPEGLDVIGYLPNPYCAA